MPLPAISSKGRFRNSYGIARTPHPSEDGYARVNINSKIWLVHRLVAMAFLPRVEGKNEVNHKTSIKSNNCVEDLEWTSHSENIQHAYKARPKRDITKRCKPVRGRKVGSTEWTRYGGARLAAQALKDAGVHGGNVTLCCQGKKRQTRGFEFQYAQPNEPETLETEEWRDALNGQVAVSSLGRYRNPLGIVYTPTPCPDGYSRVTVHGQRYSIHLLIAEAFDLPRPEGTTEVNHKDGNRSNNRKDNLEWVTSSENKRHSYATNHDRRSCAPAKSFRLRIRRVDESTWTWYTNAEAAASVLGLLASNIRNWATGTVCRSGEYIVERDPLEPDVLEGEVWCELTEEILANGV